jgi:hypothetical protein
MGILMKENGDVSEVYPQERKNTFSLKEMQGFVGGYIEIVSVGQKYLVLNEEGKLNGLEINLKATEIFQKHYGQTDVIVGDVLLIDSDEVE